MNSPDSVSFHTEGDLDFSLENESTFASWLKSVALEEGSQITDLNYIFTSDEDLHKVNLKYLEHDTYTDIITFDNSDKEDEIEGDIFISVERVKENSETYNTLFINELSRVLVHGLLHLLGYGDKTEDEKSAMRSLEDKYIQRLEL